MVVVFALGRVGVSGLLTSPPFFYVSPRALVTSAFTGLICDSLREICFETGYKDEARGGSGRGLI
jgi:hypothetical protein